MCESRDAPRVRHTVVGSAACDRAHSAELGADDVGEDPIFPQRVDRDDDDQEKEDRSDRQITLTK